MARVIGDRENGEKEYVKNPEEYDVILNEIDTDNTELQASVEGQFTQVVDHINYEPIFDIQNKIFEHIPTSKVTNENLKQLIEEFKEIKLDEVNEDLIGQIYEELISEKERKKLGQFYTPPSVAESIVRWTLNTSQDAENPPKVLDPACESGTFPVEAYKYIDETHNVTHQDIINSLYLVDINKFPLHLAGINLTSMNIQEPTSHINYKNLSFFEYEEPDEFGEFDAVVGNPPYIRGNQLKKMGVLDSFRDHLREYNPDGNKKPEYYSGTKKFRNDTDSFIYFITNSLRYLREGGRMGMIVPAKWMETQYGAKFQQFLFDNTKIHSVITFSNRVFDDAKVKSSVLLLEKCSDATKRANSTVNFIQVNNTLNPEDILPAIDYNPELETVYELTQMDGFSICSIQQDDLKSRPKWSYLYRAPERVIELIENSEFKTLSDFAKVTSGTKSGANPFFHLDEDDIKQHGVNRQFLRPLIKSIRDCSEEDPVFLEEDTDKYILDINWYVNMNNLSSYDELLNQLETDGYSNLRDYLEYGKSKGYDDRPSTSSRKIWCSIPSMDVPAVIQPTFINERSFVVSNIDELPINDSLSGIQFNDDIEFEIGIALLNTYLYKMLLELWGKTEGDGVLQLKTYDIESVPFPDIDKLGETEKELLRKSYENVKKGEYDGLADKVILDMLDIDDITVREIEKVYDSLESARLEGVESEVLLNREESSGSEFEEMNLEEFM